MSSKPNRKINSFLFNRIFLSRCGKMPDRRKLANFVIVHKGETRDVESTRYPVGLLLIGIWVIEMSTQSAADGYLIRSQLLCQHQQVLLRVKS